MLRLLKDVGVALVLSTGDLKQAMPIWITRICLFLFFGGLARIYQEFMEIFKFIFVKWTFN